ncbi:MAG: nitroreductase family protein [Polyangiaceae bacterium]
MSRRPYVPVPLQFSRRPEQECLSRARSFSEELRTRRSVRHFSKEPVPIEAIERCIEAAASAPSGANKQP